MAKLGMVIDLRALRGMRRLRIRLQGREQHAQPRRRPELQLGRLPDEDRGHFPERHALGDAGAVQPLHGGAVRCGLPGHAKGDVQDPGRHHDARRRALHRLPEVPERVPVQPSDARRREPQRRGLQRDQLQSPRRRHAAAVDRQDRAHTRMYGVRRRNRAAGGRHDPDVEQVECGRRRSGAPGRRGREVHILLPPHEPRAAARVRRGLPVAGAHLRRPGRSKFGHRESA